MVLGSRRLTMVLLALSIWSSGIPVAFADVPTDQVKETVGRVVAILRDPNLRQRDRTAERRAMLRRIILTRFDFSEMARRSLGNHWKDEQVRQEEFVAAFTDFVESTYIGKVEQFKDEKIVYARERMDQDYAEVDTNIVPGKGEPFSIIYRLHLVGSEWKVYDVVIENISLVNNYRAQFNRILATASFDELLKKLREKSSGTGS